MTQLYLVSIKKLIRCRWSKQQDSHWHSHNTMRNIIVYIVYKFARWKKGNKKISLCRIGKCIGDHGLNTRPAKDEDNKIAIGCYLVEIATVRCKVRHMIGLLCAKIMSPWYNCCFCVSLVLISKFNILSIGNVVSSWHSWWLAI